LDAQVLQKKKDRNPNDPDISISTQYQMTQYLKKIFQYSKKHKNLKEQRKRIDVQRMPKSRKKSARKAHNMT
jgi:hypothetical protein